MIRLVLCAALLFVVSACSDDADNNAMAGVSDMRMTPPDVPRDAGDADAGPVVDDAGVTTPDADSPEPDSGVGSDAGSSDAGQRDSGVADAGSDAGADAGEDIGMDAGMDMAMDAGADAGVDSTLGDACDRDGDGSECGPLSCIKVNSAPAFCSLSAATLCDASNCPPIGGICLSRPFNICYKTCATKTDCRTGFECIDGGCVSP